MAVDNDPSVSFARRLGLIGRLYDADLRAREFHVSAVARKFRSQRSMRSTDLPVCRWTRGAVRLIRDHAIEIIVQCLGVLPDGPCAATQGRASRFVRD